MALLNFYYYVNECFRYNLANDIARAGEDCQHREDREYWTLFICLSMTLAFALF